jgi:hypothetical protein
MKKYKSFLHKLSKSLFFIILVFNFAFTFMFITGALRIVLSVLGILFAISMAAHIYFNWDEIDLASDKSKGGGQSHDGKNE